MDLQNKEVKIDNEDMAIRLPYSLPPSFKHFSETLLYGKDDLSLDDVRDALTPARDLIDNKLTAKSSGLSQYDVLLDSGSKNNK